MADADADDRTRGETREAADDAAALARYGDVLIDAVDAALPRWVARAVADSLQRAGRSRDELGDAVAGAGAAARADVVPRLRALLALDIDEQRTNPLSVLRAAVVHPTAVLRDAGVPAVPRDEFAERAFPDDVYDLSPASFGDIDPALHEPGLAWGAAKAHVHLRRRRAEGRR